MTGNFRDRALLVSPLAVLGVLVLTPAMERGPTLCPFALCTGMACPGCGMTRAASRLVRGDLAGAVTLHPLVPLIVLLGVAGWLWYLMRRAGRVEPMSSRLVNGILTVTLLALIAVWIARLAMGSLPDV